MSPSVNEKGVIGLAKVTSDLVAQGYEVFHPFSDACAIDLIVADRSMGLRRVQVKYRTPEESGKVLLVSLDSVVNGRRVPVDTSKIDAWAIYCPTTDTVYYVRRDEVLNRTIRLCLLDFKGRKNALVSERQDPARLFGS